MKISKVYTKTGDAGTTSLVGGQRINKDDCRLEAYGTVDELNSQLGLLVAVMPDGDEKVMVERMQCCLFNVGTHLATDLATTPLYPSAKLPEGEVASVEQAIDDMIAAVPPLDGFILPGGCLAAAQAHVCRAVCRRAERRVIALQKQAQVGDEIVPYLNRMSDYLFVLSRKLNFLARHVEKKWINACR